MKNKIKKIVTIILLSIMSFSGYKIYEAQSSYKEIINLDNEKLELIETAQKEAEEKGEPVPDKITPLNKENPDTLGWVTYERANISTVVMNEPEGQKDYYLHRSFNKSYLYAGEAYVQGKCKLSPDGTHSCGQTLIYGHAMKNGTRFFGINNLIDKTFDEKDIVTIETSDKIMKYQVMGISEGKAYKTNEPFRYFNYSEFNTDELFDEFINGLNRTKVAGDFSGITKEDTLVTLSTCNTHNLDIRYGLIAKLVEVIEK